VATKVKVPRKRLIVADGHNGEAGSRQATVAASKCRCGNDDASGNCLLMARSSAVGTHPRPGSAAGTWPDKGQVRGPAGSTYDHATPSSASTAQVDSPCRRPEPAVKASAYSAGTPRMVSASAQGQDRWLVPRRGDVPGQKPGPTRHGHGVGPRWQRRNYTISDGLHADRGSSDDSDIWT